MIGHPKILQNTKFLCNGSVHRILEKINAEQQQQQQQQQSLLVPSKLG
jgi:hypothetical protein